MFSKFFVDRPVFACVLSIVIMLMGGIAYFGLPVAQYPELAPPIVRVEALYPGANASTVADTVAAPIEQEVNGVDGMIYMSSVSGTGRYSLDISFQPGTDVDTASVLVQNRVSIALAKLPEEARRLGVTTRKQSTTLVGVIALSSPDGSVDDITLSNFLTLNWRDEIARIPGVGGITVMPSKEYGMRVWLDPEKLKARNLSVAEVRSAVQSQNVQVPAGSIGQQPAPTGTDFEFIVTTKGRLSTAEEFADIIVKSTEEGRIVRLREVGRVELGARDYGTLATFNGAPNAILVVYQLPGANLVDVSNRVKAALARLTAPDYPVKVPQGAEAKLFYDSAMFIEASVHEVFKTLIEAFVLVFLVVLIFLQSFRTTLIPALTIPVSLIGTLFVMQILGFSINMLTLFGLVLAIGIVVDDAIVVVENVERNITQHGLSPREATIKAMGEITGAVIAITLVLMSVFLPTAALPGISGEMYRQFALTIAASTAISAICALTLSPALCALILSGHHKEDPTKKKSAIKRFVSAPARIFNTCFDALTAAYAGFTKLSIRLALVTVLVFGAVTAFTLWSFARVPTGFVPEEDLGFVVVSAQLPDGASLERSKAVIDRVSAAVQKVDGVADVVALSGFSILQGNGGNVANCWVVLEPWGDRYSRGRGLSAVMADINAAVAPVQEASFLVFSLPAIQGLGNASGFDMRVQDVSNVGRDALGQATNETVAKAFTQQGILAAFTGFRAGVPQLFLDIDRERAIKTGVPLQSVFDTLQTALGSSYVNDFNLAGRTFQVNLQADAQFRLRAEDILKLEVRHPNGQMVPLGALASIRETIGPDRVERYNMYQSSTINGIPAPGTSSGAALDIMEAISKETILPAGLSFEWTAMSFQERQLGSQAIVVFALAILLVYLILAAQYESFTMPLAVVLSVPLVILGAVIALNVRGLDNNIFTQVGLVLLVGLGAKNAILIVEFARENLAKGMTPLDAAVDAAKTRFRPIIMTSLAFILGVVPLLGATGAGAGSRQAIGTAVFGGMISNTVLGLLFTPALFYIVVRVVRLFKKDAFLPKQHETPATHTSVAH